MARADHLFHEDTEASIHSAIALAPDGWKYYMRLAQLDPKHSQDLLATALRLDRYNAEANIEMGLQYESQGDYVKAEHSFLEAYAVDHTYLPRWSLASYYFRRDNIPAFWTWARSAAAMPSNEIGALLELCWRVSPDPEQITSMIANDKPEFLRQYIDFLQSKNRADAAAVLASQLIRYDNPAADRSRMLSVINGLVTANDADAAISLWHLLIERHWVFADDTTPNNADFARAPLPVSFDWLLPEYSGMYSLPGPMGLETDFSGNEPESCIIAEQTIVLTPGNYALDYSYQTSDISPDTGIQWQIVDAKSNAILASSPDLFSNALKHAVLMFSTPQGAPLLSLRLIYRRTPETSRISGTLLVRSTRIHAQPSS
ncbi:MAG TPA: hypothetical protein VMD58_08265 [Acidobacteriaceae bacterium]|nr:hypothetical protein [Acidobacteriaceae bacterium]